ncbi:glycosyltransferase [Pelagibius sp. Alg239-R121]|uniref:glycosyltransferase n=1 Tax=Pelagibius sp. Alg239-R121 TaxID=2993448 RepID=UPI0024A6A8CD|nr:glycosyltransferase [Pelagibius sp. Alg239-R121]
MSSESLKRVALSNRLEQPQGFAGSQTPQLFHTALSLAGYQVIDADQLLQDDQGGSTPRTDAWISLRSETQEDEEAMRYCSQRSLPYYLIDPVLSDLEPTTQDDNALAGRACCFLPQANRLNQQSTSNETAVYVPPFLDPGPYFSTQRDAESLRQNLSQRYNLQENVRWILLSVPAGCNSDSLVSTFESLSRLYMFDWNLVVSAHDENRHIVEQLLPRLPAKSRYLIRNDVPGERTGFLAASDIFLTAERNGDAVFDILEALASGLAVVANKCPAVEEVVENGVTGRLSAAGNPASLSNDLTFLLRHSNFLKSYRDNTRGQIAARHDILVATQVLRGLLSPRI